jgi:predicted TIM-barrel fold metal-dependent hydrolase
MSILNNQRVIAIEEHYYDADVVAHFRGVDARTGGFVREQLEDVSEARIQSMDEAGIDVQVLSHGAPSTQRMDAETGVRLAKAANDRLYEICQTYPDRFAGFAALPTADPKAAADELERSVEKLGLNRPGNNAVAFRDLFTSHFYITTSGFFSDPALLCCIQEMGADRILFAIDYPFVPNEPGPQWMERLMLNAEDKGKILHGNAERLLRL